MRYLRWIVQLLNKKCKQIYMWFYYKPCPWRWVPNRLWFEQDWYANICIFLKWLYNHPDWFWMRFYLFLTGYTTCCFICFIIFILF